MPLGASPVGGGGWTGAPFRCFQSLAWPRRCRQFLLNGFWRFVLFQAYIKLQEYEKAISDCDWALRVSAPGRSHCCPSALWPFGPTHPPRRVHRAWPFQAGS